MPSTSLLQTAEADLRTAARRYTQAQTRGDFVEAMLGFHAGLEKAFDAMLQLSPEEGDVPFAQKAQRVVPGYSQELRRLNSVRNDITHHPGAVSDQDALAASTGFAQITVRVWGQLFSSAPPSLARPATGAAPASSQAPAGSAPQSTAGAEAKTRRFRWLNLLGVIVLLPLTSTLAGVAFYIWTNDVAPIYWSIALVVIVLILGYLTALNAWRFVRAFGLFRLLGVASALIVVASLILVPFGPGQSGLAAQAGAAFTRVLEVTYDLTIGVVPTQFVNGQNLASLLFDRDGAAVAPVSLPASAAPEEQTISATAMPTSVIEETQLTPAPSPADSPSAQPPSAATGSIGVGASVIVQTDGAALLGRVNPGRSSEIAVRFPNGAQLTVLDGPQEADGLIWWQVEGEAGSGWSAGNFLQLADE